MKDIYELLNDIDIDESEMEEMEISEFEKEKVKNNVKKKMRKKSFWRKKGVIAAAICCAVIGGVGAVGVINPAYAANIPIVGDIFRFLDGEKTGAYDKYQENAKTIGETQESNGIAVTLQDAIFDGQTISYTYEVVTDKDFGEDIGVTGRPDMTITNYYGGMGGGSTVKKVGPNQYVGMNTWTLDSKLDSVEANIHFDLFYYFENDEYKEIEGNWNFKFLLDAVEGMEKVINQAVESNGVKVAVESITETPMSFVIRYTDIIPKNLKGDPVNEAYVKVEIKDDLGNEYPLVCNSEFGSAEQEETDHIAVIGKPAKEAKELFIMPTVAAPTGGGGVAIDENGNEEEIPWEENPNAEFLKTIHFDNIVIELEQ